MYAYRSKEKNNEMERVACGQNDGGESGSGDRLARLLELSNCDEVIVVVSRWYGGTKLGSDRWKHISQVAKEALYKGGFSRREDPPQGTTGKKRRKK
jgi:putative IMPACT (imprinted ancient) family translation regulator